MGKIPVSVRKVNEKIKIKLDLVIIQNKMSIPLVGRSWINVLWPDWRNYFGVLNKNIFLVSQFDISVDFLRSKYPNVLSDINKKLPIKHFTANIVLKLEAKPIFHKAYSVPYKLRDDVEKELSKMCDEGILKPVKHSQWASPIVIVPKTNSIRICIDAKRTINKFIEMEHYPLPRMDDIFADLSNCEFFCVIDLSKAYLQLEVSVESQEYLTINTSKGLFRYTRLPFGVASAPSIFQSVMDQVLINLKGVKCYLDDILVGASNKLECKNKLLLVLQRLHDHNIKINLDKCKFFVMEVNFLGHTISKLGISPKSGKMDAILKAPAPKNLTELQAYLGLLNYYGRFIPNLSMEIRKLYDLLRKDVKFDWNSDTQKVFENSKQLIVKNNILELYDPNKEIIVSADGSPYGVGAVLSHLVNGVEKPVLFVSSSLSPAEKNYSQLHREALAIVFAIKKFHKYIYGKPFTIFSDSQALREIFSPSKGTNTVAASRLQRWAVILSMYNYTIKYKPSKQMCHADALSRLPLPSPTKISDNSINRLLSQNCPMKFEVLKKSQSEDKTIMQLISYVKDGWPKVFSKEYNYYFKLRNDFSIEDNCLFYYDRIVIPSHWREAVLTVLHECHTGMVRMKMLSRTYVWWKNINTDIENFVKSCLTCQQTRNVKKEVIESKWPRCTYPFERLHIDFFHFEGKTFLIIFDVFSKFIDVILMSKTDAKSVTCKLNVVFSYFGLPKQIVSDNGPPFNSYEYDEYGQSLDIIITKTPPHHPPSNGSGERGVQTCKSVLKKLFLNNKNSNFEEVLSKFLFHYRNIPSTSTNKSPSELLLSYKCRSNMTLINPKGLNKSVKVNINENYINKNKKDVQVKNKVTKSKSSNYQEFLKNRILFNPGEKVLYRNHFKSEIKWIPAIVIKKVSEFMYLIKLNNYIRTVHENQIRKSELADKYHPLIDNLPIPLPIQPESKKEVTFKLSSPKRNAKRKRTQSCSPLFLRRSKRIKKKVIRYGSVSN